MRPNSPFAISVALHGAVAITAVVLAARAHRTQGPPEDLVWIEMASPPEPPAPKPPSPPARPPDPPKSPSPAAAPPGPARAAAARPSGGGPKSGTGPSGGGMGVLAGDGAGDGFEMDPTPGNGDGTGPVVVAAAPPEPPPPPPKPLPPRPKQPTCDEALTKPKPLAKPRSIEYPEAARADGKEGRLLLDLSIAEDGSVGAVAVVSGVHPALDAAAVAAVKTWRFEPASRCGKPESGSYRVARRFQLGD